MQAVHLCPPSSSDTVVGLVVTSQRLDFKNLVRSSRTAWRLLVRFYTLKGL